MAAWLGRHCAVSAATGGTGMGGGQLQVVQCAAGLLHLLPEIHLCFHPFQLQLTAGHSVGTLTLPSKT